MKSGLPETGATRKAGHPRLPRSLGRCVDGTVALEANTTYFVVSQEVNGGDHWYDDNTGVATTNGATVTAAVYATNNSTAYSLGTGTTTNSYVPVNFKCATGAWNLAKETHSVYDGGVVVQERDQNNVPQVAYSRGLDLSRSRQGAGGIGGLLARTDLTAGTSAYYHCDAGGNISEMVNANGSVVAIYRYDPFGNLTGQAGPLANANPYRFSSKEWSANAALYYYGYRFYDPDSQRWLNRDPLGERVGANLYECAYNDPANLIDPNGEDAVTIGPVTIPIPGTTEWWEADLQSAHEGQHRADWLRECPGWKKEQRGFAAEIPVIQAQLRAYQAFLDSNRPCLNQKAEQNLQNAINGLNNELVTAETIANNDLAAMDYWNAAARRWYQSPVPTSPLPPGYVPPPSNVNRNAPPAIRRP